MLIMKTKELSRLLCFVGFLDLFGVSMILPLIPAQVLKLGASSLLVGGISSLYGGVQLFSSPIIGSWSDVRGTRFVLTFCLLSSGLSYFALGCSDILYILILSRVLAGVIKHSQTLLMSAITNVIPSEERSSYYGFFNSITNIGFILGPTVGGHVAEYQNGFFLVSCIVTSVFFFNAFIIWTFIPESANMKTEEKKVKESSNDHSGSKKSYLKEFSANFEECWDIMAFRLILGFATLVYRSNFSLVLLQKYEFTPKYVGYLTSYQGVVSTFAGLVVGYLSNLDTNTNRQTVYGVFLLTCSLIGLTLCHSIVILVLSLTTLSLSTSFLRVCLSSVVASRCDKTKFGAIAGMGQSVTSLARMLAPVIGGAALEYGSAGPGLVGSVSSGIGLVLSLYLCANPLSKIKRD